MTSGRHHNHTKLTLPLLTIEDSRKSMVYPADRAFRRILSSKKVTLILTQFNPFERALVSFHWIQKSTVVVREMRVNNIVSPLRLFAYVRSNSHILTLDVHNDIQGTSLKDPRFLFFGRVHCHLTSYQRRYVATGTCISVRLRPSRRRKNLV